MHHFSRVASTLLASLFVLTACGGGGGGGGSDPGPTTPTTPTTPPPAATLAGSLWHSDADISDTQGTFASDLVSGNVVRVDAEKWSVPSPDGSRIMHRAYTSQGSVGDETRVIVRRVSDGQVLTDLTVDGYVGDLSQSPKNASQVMAPWSESINGARSNIVYDIGQQKLLFATSVSSRPDAISWLPDGAVLRVKSSGEISKVVLGGAEQVLGTAAWPESRVVQAIYASPDGTKALVQLAALRSTGSVSGVDLWMMNVDGTGMRRFTKNDLISNAFWSPDGKFVAFSKDTGVVCTDATCQGSCTVWYADAGASDVVAVEGSNDAQRFTVKRSNGSTKNLSCPVMAWTR